jgi:hypothetical protein
MRLIDGSVARGEVSVPAALQRGDAHRRVAAVAALTRNFT